MQVPKYVDLRLKLHMARRKSEVGNEKFQVARSTIFNIRFNLHIARRKSEGGDWKFHVATSTIVGLRSRVDRTKDIQKIS